MSFTVTDVKDFHKVAFKYKVNDFALWIDGVEVGTDVNGSIFPASTLDRLEFGLGSGYSTPFYGRCKDLRYFDSALTDLELLTLTT